MTNKSLDDEIENIRSFSSWLSDEKIKYFHVIIPAPVGNQEDELNVQRAGYQVYSNQMADEFKEALELYHIDCVDIRDYMIEDNKSYTDSFFRYEHHMVPSAGIWVAGIVSDHIDEIDLRIFTGSLQAYIEQTEPDIVISMYSAYDFNSAGAETLYEFE